MLLNTSRFLPLWLRIALYATALMNIGGGFAFVPALGALRNLFGLPTAPTFFYWILFFWIEAFGVAYFALARSGHEEPVFLGVAAAGKLSFAGLLIGYTLQGGFPPQAALASLGDLFFGLLFLGWLLRRPA